MFYLGTKYSSSMKAVYLDEKGTEQLMHMGCYGIGIGRTAAAAIEQNHDANGIIWPYAIAPFQYELICLNLSDENVKKTSEEIYRQLTDKGFEVLLDDREESPGVKFKDADLIGIPLRIVVSSRTLKEKNVEWKMRSETEGKMVGLTDVVGKILGFVHSPF